MVVIQLNNVQNRFCYIFQVYFFQTLTNNHLIERCPFLQKRCMGFLFFLNYKVNFGSGAARKPALLAFAAQKAAQNRICPKYSIFDTNN